MKELEVYWRNKFQDKLDEFTALKKNNKELIEFLREVATKGNDFISIHLSGKYYGKDIIEVINELKSKKQ
jgi:hypothetical protein